MHILHILTIRYSKYEYAFCKMIRCRICTFIICIFTTLKQDSYWRKMEEDFWPSLTCPECKRRFSSEQYYLNLKP